MNSTEPAQPLGLVSSAQLGQADPERAKPRAWAIFVDSGNARMWTTLQPHVQKLADAEGLEVTPLYDRAALDFERRKALRDASRWVDEEVGHALQDGWSVESVQALMATRDMLRAHADMQAMAVEVKA